MAAPNISPHPKLAKLFQIIDGLTPNSSLKQFEAFGALFGPNGTAYLHSMREYDEPTIGRPAIISSMQSNIKTQHVVERRILSQAESSDGLTLLVEMKNRIHVLGQILDPFYETTVVVFDEEGLIVELKQYSCRSHIVEIIQEQTGIGPYEGIPITRGMVDKRATCCQ